MRRDSRSIRSAALSLLVGGGAACAADAGDPSKLDGGSSAATVNHDTGSVPADSAIKDYAMSSSSSSGSSGSGSGSGSDSGSSSGSGGGGSDAGAGCATGAKVITLASQNANTMNFSTVGAVCVQFQGGVHQGWGVSNMQGRMVKLTSASGTVGPIDASGTLVPPMPMAPQAGADGFVYWNFSAGSVDYASMYIF